MNALTGYADETAVSVAVKNGVIVKVIKNSSKACESEKTEKQCKDRPYVFTSDPNEDIGIIDDLLSELKDISVEE